MSGYPMIASHITNKEVSKYKVMYPMGYTVIIMSISYYIQWQVNIHNHHTLCNILASYI